MMRSHRKLKRGGSTNENFTQTQNRMWNNGNKTSKVPGIIDDGKRSNTRTPKALC